MSTTTDLTRRFGRTMAVAGVTPGRRPGRARAARPERGGQDLAAADDGHGDPAVLGADTAARTRSRRLWAAPADPAPARLRATEPGLLPGVHGRGVRRVLRAVEGDAARREVHRAVAAAVERVGLGDKAKAKLRTLSGGMLRRVGIAQAIVNEPELLLLDEPTAGLDPEQRVAFRALLRELGQRATVIVSTHLVEDVGAACTQVALMDQGKIVFRGTPDELTARGVGTAAAGDAPLERGYSAVLAEARRMTAAPVMPAPPGRAGHHTAAGGGRSAAAVGAAPQRDAVDAADRRRAVLVRSRTGRPWRSRRCGTSAR